MTPVANLPPVSLIPMANCHRCPWHQNFPPVSLTPLANLPPVSTTLAKLVAKFATGVVYTCGAPWLVNISGNFRKKFELVLMGYSGAGGETDSWKKPEAKNLVSLSLQQWKKQPKRHRSCLFTNLHSPWVPKCRGSPTLVSKVSRGHPSLVSLVNTLTQSMRKK